MSKHTPWFEGQIKPTRVGVYRTRREPYAHIPSQRARAGRVRFNYFDGHVWYPGYPTAEEAYRKGLKHVEAHDPGAYQDLEWQGLTEAELELVKAEAGLQRSKAWGMQQVLDAANAENAERRAAARKIAEEALAAKEAAC